MSILKRDRDVLKLKQPAALNRYAAPELWMPSTKVMRKVADLWPFVLLIAVFGLEMLLLHWASQSLKGETPKLEWGRVFMAVFLMPATVPLFVPLMVWGERWSPRMLKVDGKGLTCSGRKPLVFRWWQVLKFEVEPLTEAPAMVRLSITQQRRADLPPRSWTIILDRVKQWMPLLEKLKLRHAADPNFIVREFHQPKPEVPRLSLNARIMWPLAVLMFLLYNGMPLLIAGMRMQSGDAPQRAGTAPAKRMTPAQRFIAENFNSVRSLRRAFLIAGGAMTAGSIGLIVWSNRRMKAVAQKDLELYWLTEQQLEKIPHDVLLKRRA